MDTRTITVVERPEVSRLSIVLGFGPASLIVAGAVTALVASGDGRTFALRLTTIYSAAILTFLAGVRRGLSFRTESGPTLAQLATVFAFFTLALVALFGTITDHLRIAASALVAGFAIAMVVDPVAATRGEAPLFFRRLRPLQMAIATVGALMLSVTA